MKMRLIIFTLLLAGFLSSSCIVNADDSERRARWHATFTSAEPVGREITKIAENSTLSKAGLKVGDIILAINGESIKDVNHWWDLTYQLRGSTEYLLKYKRNNIVSATSIMFDSAPKETFENLHVEYGFITNDYGIRQRTITTIPKNYDAKLPGIFVIGGLSCSSIEKLPGKTSNFVRGLRDLAEASNMIMMRVEKPGVGDSQGRCSETDFHTELNGYEVALKTLLQDKRVDAQKMLIYGNSMGGAIAPYFANKYGLAGVISDGPYYRSWFEHMLEIERRIQSMNGHNQTEVNRRIIEAFIPLYHGMLVEKKSYQQIITENPLLSKYNYHSDQHMYGRPMAFYHQLQDFNVAGEWANLRVPARIRWGTNDWIMSEYDIDMINQTLIDNGNNDVQVAKVKDLDHWFAFHESVLDSYHGKPGKWDDSISQTLVIWANDIIE